MTYISSFAKAAALAAIAVTSAAPAFAKAKPVVVSAATFSTPESRLCMAAATVGLRVEKDQPQVMCMSRSEWEAKGVTFKIK